MPAGLQTRLRQAAFELLLERGVDLVGATPLRSTITSLSTGQQPERGVGSHLGRRVADAARGIGDAAAEVAADPALGAVAPVDSS